MATEEVKPTATKTEQKAPVSETKPTKELQTNCLGCSKPIRKLKHYYRDGKFFCHKKCWKKFINSKKIEEKK